MTYSSQLCCPSGFVLVLVVLLSHPGSLDACNADAANPLSSLIWCWLVLLVLASWCWLPWCYPHRCWAPKQAHQAGPSWGEACRVNVRRRYSASMTLQCWLLKLYLSARGPWIISFTFSLLLHPFNYTVIPHSVAWSCKSYLGDIVDQFVDEIVW